MDEQSSRFNQRSQDTMTSDWFWVVAVWGICLLVYKDLLDWW
jgi:hypothetical protein